MLAAIGALLGVAIGRRSGTVPLPAVYLVGRPAREPNDEAEPDADGDGAAAEAPSRGRVRRRPHHPAEPRRRDRLAPVAAPATRCAGSVAPAATTKHADTERPTTKPLATKPPAAKPAAT